MTVHPQSGGLTPDIAAQIAQELAALAADAKTLSSRLSAGEVVAAIVLPSNGLTDLLDIGGLRVAAELPPTLLPGEAIRVMVTGFSGDRINLQILPGAPPAPAAQRPAPGAPNARQAAAGAFAPASPAVPAKPGGSSAAPTPAVAPTSAAPNRAGASPALPSADSDREGPAQFAVRMRMAQPAAAAPALHLIEARLAAAHATAVPPARPFSPAAASVFSAKAPSSGASAPLAGPPAFARPAIPMRPPPQLPAAVVSPAVPRGPAAFAEPAALLRALQLPVTATNVAAARMALESPEKLPAALAVLERALTNGADPRVATLTTLTSFLARIDPRSPVFATQIAAFADHVVTGREARLAQLAGAVDAAPVPAASERAAVVRAALDYDLKTQLLALAANRASSPEAATPQGAALDRAVAGALTAVTAVQLNAAAALKANPEGLAFSVPIALADGFANAHVRIDRDAPGGRQAPLDSDNFHLAFILETRRLGTVVIDVLTVGRDVTLSLKTEAAPAQRAFRGNMKGLTARLQHLRYRVAKAEAIVAPPAAAIESAPARAPARDPARHVDFDA